MTSQVIRTKVLKTKPLATRRFQLMALEHIEKRAERIKARREELGITQEDVADKMQEAQRELHPDDAPDQTRGQMVSDWERAVNEPRPHKLELLAAALDTTVAALNTDAPDKSGPTPDPFTVGREVPAGAAAVERLESQIEALDQKMESRHSALMSALSEVHDELELLRTHGQLPGHGRAEG